MTFYFAYVFKYIFLYVLICLLLIEGFWTNMVDGNWLRRRRGGGVGRWTRQSRRRSRMTLSSSRQRLRTPLPSVALGHSAKTSSPSSDAVTAAFLCRVPPGNRQTSLPSAREKVLGKEGFVDALCAEPSLSSATLGKAFAECF
jgi:hypothetical protein